jgi:pyochelin biosynthetic protein PchC
MASPAADGDLWIRRYHPAPGSAIRLVCLPHAGGSASYYFGVSRELAPGIEVLAVQYPGRQDRHREPLIDSVADLADQISTALVPIAGQPFAFFGHSMGAILAFEVAQRLRTRLGVSPQRLFVSGRRAPSETRTGNVHRRDDAGLLAELNRLGGTDKRLLNDPELLSAILTVSRNDYKAAETYAWVPGGPLDCPVTALIGSADPQATVEEAKVWREHTTGAFDLRVFPGGHFYLDQARAEVLETIVTGLAGVVHADPREGSSS